MYILKIKQYQSAAEEVPFLYPHWFPLRSLFFSINPFDLSLMIEVNDFPRQLNIVILQ